jgi:hypothetical protein
MTMNYRPTPLRELSRRIMLALMSLLLVVQTTVAETGQPLLASDVDTEESGDTEYIVEEDLLPTPFLSAAIASAQVETRWNESEGAQSGFDHVHPLRDTSLFLAYARKRSATEQTIEIADGSSESPPMTPLTLRNPTSVALCVKHLRVPAGLVPPTGLREPELLEPESEVSIPLTKNHLTVWARPGSEEQCHEQTTKLLAAHHTSSLFEVSYSIYQCNDMEVSEPLRTTTLAVPVTIQAKPAQAEACNFDELTVTMRTFEEEPQSPVSAAAECPGGMVRRDGTNVPGGDGCYCPFGEAPRADVYARETKATRHCAPPPQGDQGAVDCGEHTKLIPMADGSYQCQCEPGYGVAQNAKTICQKIPQCQPHEYVDDTWGFTCKSACPPNTVWSKDGNVATCSCGEPGHPFYWNGVECLPRPQCKNGEFLNPFTHACERKCDIGTYPVLETEVAPGIPGSWKCCPDGTVVSGDRCVAPTQVCKCPAGTQANSAGMCASSTSCASPTATPSTTPTPAITTTSTLKTTPTAVPSPQSTAVACATPVPPTCSQQLQDRGAASSKNPAVPTTHRSEGATGPTLHTTHPGTDPAAGLERAPSIDPDPQAGMPDAPSASADVDGAQQGVNAAIDACGDTAATPETIKTLSHKLPLQQLKKRRQQLLAILKYQDDPESVRLRNALESATDEETITRLIENVEAKLGELRAGRTDLQSFLSKGFKAVLDQLREKAQKVFERNGEAAGFFDTLQSIFNRDTNTPEVQEALSEFSAAYTQAVKELHEHRHELTPEAMSQLSVYLEHIFNSVVSTGTTRDEQIELGGKAVGAYAHLVYRTARLTAFLIAFNNALRLRSPDLTAAALAMVTYELEIIRMMKNAAIESESYEDYADRFYKDVDPVATEQASKVAIITGAITWIILRGKTAANGDVRVIAKALEMALGLTGIEAILSTYLDGLLLIGKGIAEGDAEAQREGWKKLTDAGIDSANLTAIYEGLRKIGLPMEKPYPPAFGGKTTEQLIKKYPPPIQVPHDAKTKGPLALAQGDYLTYTFNFQADELRTPLNGIDVGPRSVRFQAYYHDLNRSRASTSKPSWKYKFRTGSSGYVLLRPAGSKGPYAFSDMEIIPESNREVGTSIDALRDGTATPEQKAIVFGTWTGLGLLYRYRRTLLELGRITPADVKYADDVLKRGHFRPGTYEVETPPMQ